MNRLAETKTWVSIVFHNALFFGAQRREIWDFHRTGRSHCHRAFGAHVLPPRVIPFMAARVSF